LYWPEELLMAMFALLVSSLDWLAYCIDKEEDQGSLIYSTQRRGRARDKAD
jgi:hypothetical protein